MGPGQSAQTSLLAPVRDAILTVSRMVVNEQLATQPLLSAVPRRGADVLAAAAGGQLRNPRQGSGGPRLHRGFAPSASQADAAESGIKSCPLAILQTLTC